MARSAGSRVRTTSGTATTACASGRIHQERVRASGGRARVMRKPKPTVTAETPSGSMKAASSPAMTRASARLRGRRETTRHTATPRLRAMAAAATATDTELAAASHTVTSRALRPPVEPRSV